MGRKSSVSLVNRDGVFCSEILQWAEERPGTTILESHSRDALNTASYLFSRPVETIEARRLDDVPAALEQIEHAVAEGYYAAGCVSYEAGYAFEARFSGSHLPETTLLWFGVYEAPLALDSRSHLLTGSARSLAALREYVRTVRRGLTPSHVAPQFRPSIPAARYLDAFDRVQRYIEEGDTYQVNLTFRLISSGDVRASILYDRMRKAQRVKYGAFINTGNILVLSCSPELFFRRKGDRIVLKPMKGTVARGRTLSEDIERRIWLAESEKNRAENLMIVDLLRNDVGKIAQPGSVEVKKFFEVERYETVFQATSTIEARLKKGTGISDLFRSLFPSGSVTGAPKIRTMEIIRELENGSRGMYTGSLGFFAPSTKAVFNVAIRTLVIDRETGQSEFGVGSGVVHDSRGKEEYGECLLKAKFLEDNQGDFCLIETFRWDRDGGWSLLGFHTKRLKESAQYFGFPLKPSEIRNRLIAFGQALRRGKQSVRVRLLVDRYGGVRLTRSPLRKLRGDQFVKFSSACTDRQDRFLFHKTTNRVLYDGELAKAEWEGYFDVLFCNREGEVTEGARSNILVRRGDVLLTPPLECGVLPGTYRSFLLSSRRQKVREQRLYPDDLFSADEIFACNAVRGLVRIRFPERALTA